jgi:hypothetical protein
MIVEEDIHAGTHFGELINHGNTQERGRWIKFCFIRMISLGMEGQVLAGTNKPKDYVNGAIFVRMMDGDKILGQYYSYNSTY